MRITRVAFAPLLLAAACGVGDESDGTPMDSTPDDRLCSAQFSLVGTYTVGASPPDLVNNATGEAPPDGQIDDYGCWPAGTWSFRVTNTTESNCATAPTPEAEYRFVTTYSANGTDGQGVQFETTLQLPALTGNHRAKVSSGGGGLCEGVIELYLDGGKKAWYLHPTLNVYNMNGPLAGSADYNEYAQSIYP